MFKKVFSLLLSVSIMFTICIPAYAMDSFNENTNVVYESVVPISSSVSEMISTDVSPLASGVAEVAVSVARDGTSEDVGVYLSYTGPFLSNAIRFKQIDVRNKSDLIGISYGTIGLGTGYRTFEVPGALAYVVKVGEVSVPTNIDEVKVRTTGLQVYCMRDHSTWHAVNNFGEIIEIN